MALRMRLPRVHEILIALVFIALAVLDPDQDPVEMALVLLLGALQIAEVRLPVVVETTGRAVAWILLKLAMCLVLISMSGRVDSHYYLITLLPVLSAATYLGPLGTFIFSALTASSVLSFLFTYNWTELELPL